MLYEVITPLLMQKLCAAVDASPARVEANHRVVALLQEPDSYNFV